MGDNSNTSKIIQTIKWFLNNILYQFVGIIVLFSIWVPLFPGEEISQLGWHVILSTIGMLPFMLESLLLFSGDNILGIKLTRKDKYWIHGVLFTVGTTFFIAGVSLEIERRNERMKEDPEAAHFQSTHALTGIISMGLIVLAFVLGIPAFNSNKLKGCIPAVWLKLIHNIIGQFGYIIGLVSLIYGFDTGYLRSYYTDEAILAATVITSILAAWSIKDAVLSFINQIKTIIG